MRTVKINISDNIFDKVMFFLENLSKNNIGLSIENESKNNKKIIKNFTSLSLQTKDFKFNREEAHER